MTQTEISYEPAKALIVHDIIRLDREDMLRRNVTPNGNMPLYWCDGILYGFVSLPLTDKMVDEILKGRIHWLEVQYSEMPKFVPILSLNEEEYKATMNFRIIDTSKFELHREFIKWLKQKIK